MFYTSSMQLNKALASILTVIILAKSAKLLIQLSVLLALRNQRHHIFKRAHAWHSARKEDTTTHPLTGVKNAIQDA